MKKISILLMALLFTSVANATVIKKNEVLASVALMQTNMLVVKAKHGDKSHRVFTTCTLPLRKDSNYTVSSAGSIREGSKITLRVKGRSQRCNVIAITG